MPSVVDIADLSDDDEGEVPPLLGPSCAATPSVASVPSATPAKKAPAAAAPATVPKADPKPGADLKPSTGLKKGFLSGGGGSSRPNKAAAKADAPGASHVPMVRADAAAKSKSLQLPEVQNKIEADKAEAAKLSGSNSWMTPDLLQKIAANPVLRKGFMDPRCQAAMAEMQTDPKAAMVKYGDNPEMKAFLQGFMKLMGEHFTKLADKQDEEKRQATEAMMPEALTPEQKKAQDVAQQAMADPEVRAIVAEPKIQSILAKMQSGQPFELEAAIRTDPDIVRKLRKLSQAGLLNMEWKA